VRKGCAGQLANRNFTADFVAIEPHFARNRNSTLVFGDRTSFRAKGLRRTTWNRNFTSVFSDRTSCRAKGLRGTTCKSQFYFSFLAIEPHFVRKGCDWTPGIAILLQFLAIKPHFVRKGCVSCRLVGTAPHLQERNRKEGEGKRARGEDVKIWGCGDEQMWGWEDVKMSRCMWRWADVKMRRCEDEQMWRCEDVKMRRCEDVKMRRCGDEKMWRWGDVKMWGCEDEKIWRWADVKMRGCEDVRMWR